MFEINIPPYATHLDKPVSRLIVNEMLNQRNLSLTAAVKKLNEKFPEHKTTTQNVSNKLARNSMRIYEIAQLAMACDFKLVLVGEQNHQYQSTISNPQKQNSITVEHQKSKSFTELLSDGYCEVKTLNFKSAIVAGEKSEEAAKWIEENLIDDMDETQEVMLYLSATRQFGIKVKPVSAICKFN